jgi:hypothetical protein
MNPSVRRICISLILIGAIMFAWWRRNQDARISGFWRASFSEQGDSTVVSMLLSEDTLGNLYVVGGERSLYKSHSFTGRGRRVRGSIGFVWKWMTSDSASFQGQLVSSDSLIGTRYSATGSPARTLILVKR